MQKVRRKHLLQSCLERHRGWGMSWKAAQEVPLSPLHLQGAQEASRGQRFFSENMVTLQGNAGQCIDESFYLLKETAPAAVPCMCSSCFTACCFILVPFLWLSASNGKLVLKQDLENWLFSIVTVSSRNNSHITYCIVFFKSLLKLISIVLDW